MDAGVLIARLLLACVLATAAVAKLLDLRAGQTALSDFGIPPLLTRPLSGLLPALELATAVALLWPAAAVAGGIVAFVMLAVFTVAIAVNLARGHTADCHCFGQLSSGPLGLWSIVRNIVLGGLAAFVAVAGPGATWARAFHWVGDLGAPAVAGIVGGLALVAVLTAQWVLILNLMRQNGRLLVRIEALEAHGNHDERWPGLPVGTDAPEFSLSGQNGNRTSLSALRTESEARPVVLVFSDPGCGPCKTLLPQLADWESEHRDSVTLALVTRRSGDNGGLADVERPFERVLLQQELEVMKAYGAPGTPAAVIVRPDGTIGSRLALGAEAIHKLLQDAVVAA
jgi:thiol-disulfide isomerase/thioredoxin